jgi:hypothetical protein
MEEEGIVGQKDTEAGAVMIIDGMIIIEIVTTIQAVTIIRDIIIIIITTMSIVEEDTPLITISTEGMMVATAT